MSESQQSVDFDISASHVDKFDLISPIDPKHMPTIKSQTPGRTRDTVKNPATKALGQSAEDVASLMESNDFGLSESNFSTSMVGSKAINTSGNSFKGSFQLRDRAQTQVQRLVVDQKLAIISKDAAKDAKDSGKDSGTDRKGSSKDSLNQRQDEEDDYVDDFE